MLETNFLTTERPLVRIRAYFPHTIISYFKIVLKLKIRLY